MQVFLYGRENHIPVGTDVLNIGNSSGVSMDCQGNIHYVRAGVVMHL